MKRVDGNVKLLVSDPHSLEELCNAKKHLSSLLERLQEEQDAQLKHISTDIDIVNQVFQGGLDQTDVGKGISQVHTMFRVQPDPLFELVAATLLSGKHHDEIFRLNPNLAQEHLETAQGVVAACLFRVVNLGHIRRCISDTEELVMIIQSMQEQLLLFSWRKQSDDDDLVPTNEMVVHALKFSGSGKKWLTPIHIMRKFHDTLKNLTAVAPQKKLSSKDCRIAALIAFHAASFDYDGAHEIIADADKCMNMLKLSKMGCYMDGQRLLSQSECKRCWPTSGALAATANLLQHKAQSLSTNLIAKRWYMNDDNDTENNYYYDPHFLVFEVFAFYALACTNSSKSTIL